MQCSNLYLNLWISCLPERSTEEFINTLFAGKNLLIGDRHTQVDLQVDDIIKTDVETYGETLNYLSLSPIVFVQVRPNKSIEYVSPSTPGYEEILLNHILEKYRHFFGKDFSGDMKWWQGIQHGVTEGDLFFPNRQTILRQKNSENLFDLSVGLLFQSRLIHFGTFSFEQFARMCWRQTNAAQLLICAARIRRQRQSE